MRNAVATAVFLAAAAAASSSSSSFHGNLNYASPSRRDAHANLGIDVPRVTARRSSWKRSGSGSAAARNLTFTHGVASGDPYADSVILWTRAAPSAASDRSNVTVEGTVPLYSHETDAYVRADPDPVCVGWSVFEAGKGNGTGKAAAAAASGEAYTTSDIDYTVKVSTFRGQLAGWLAGWFVSGERSSQQ